MTTPTPESFFNQTLPFIRLLSEERRDQLRLMFDGYYRSVAHFHQVMVLAAGIAGVVVPVILGLAI